MGQQLRNKKAQDFSKKSQPIKITQSFQKLPKTIVIFVIGDDFSLMLLLYYQ